MNHMKNRKKYLMKFMLKAKFEHVCHTQRVNVLICLSTYESIVCFGTKTGIISDLIDYDAHS